MSDQPFTIRSSSQQPFTHHDVILRFPAGEYALERVFVKTNDTPFVAMYWKVQDRWSPCQPTMHDVAELLRRGIHLMEQLHDTGEEKKKLLRELAAAKKKLTYIQKYWGDYSRLPAEEDHPQEWLALNLCLTQIFNMPETIPDSPPAPAEDTGKEGE